MQRKTKMRLLLFQSALQIILSLLILSSFSHNDSNLSISTTNIPWSIPLPTTVGPPTSERQALVDLFQFNNGENWVCGAHWDYPDIENYPCKLYGITCTFIKSESQWHITHVELPSCGLTGYLCESFRNLKNLSYLDLSYNFQHSPSSQPLPDQLRSLVYLRVIRLNNTGLNGTIPHWLFDTLTSLQYLDISYNNLTGSIPGQPLDSATNLRSLVIHDNPYLGGEIPQQLWELWYLKAFSFSKTNITGQIRNDWIQNAGRLEMLMGACTRIKGMIYHL